MTSAWLRVASLLVLATTLYGCPRQIVDEDGGPMPDVDSGYFLPQGNAFEGPLNLNDARLQALDPSTLRAGSTPCRAPVLVRVTRVVDGDTFNMNGIDGSVFGPVRMIGIDTPEIEHPGQPAECYGAEATEFTEQLDGHLVWLTFDNECQDSFERLLAYVHIGAGSGDLWERQLLRRGFASEFAVGNNRAYASQFQTDEAQAVDAEAGLWGACP